MAYFADLAPYAYGYHSHPRVVHVGWLDKVHPFARGPVESRLVEKMKLLAEKPIELYRGKHLCELCPEPHGLAKTMLPNGIVIDPACSWAVWISGRSGNGEIRVAAEGVTFAAPVLIIHYIEAHGYQPPTQFLEAVEKAFGSSAPHPR